ncbi:MAG TPA: M14 family zinc carboxypeptidase [Solirubrobacteraceae bacterium]|jgi:protein MpaA
MADWVRMLTSRPAGRPEIIARVAAAAVVLAAAVSLAGTDAAPASVRAGLPPRHGEVIGRSVDGRAIRAVRIGPAAAARRLLIVACVHGDEPSGEAITHRLRFVRPPAHTAIWIIDRANPDGCAAGTRKNVHGVDLNRNSPWHWAHINGPGGVFYSGPRAWSEPESRALDAFVKRVHPAITIWYHQHADLVDASVGGDVPIERDYARRVGQRLVHLGLYRGSFTGWQNTNLPGTTAFVVELPAGALPAAAVKRHVSAVVALARRRQ